MNSYKVTYYFNDEDSFVAQVKAPDMNAAFDLVAKKIEAGEVAVRSESNHMWGYNLSRVTKFNVC